MKFMVNWLPGAEQALADIWTRAADRHVVTRAANLMDQRSRKDPLHQGESRPRGRRIMFVTPLGILYRVHPDDLRVDVVHVWRFEVE